MLDVLIFLVSLVIALAAIGGTAWLVLLALVRRDTRRTVKFELGKTPAALVDAPYPWKIQSMITDTEVPLIELVLAVEDWVDRQQPRTYQPPPDAQCTGCGIVPLSAFRSGDGRLFCRDCWDRHCRYRNFEHQVRPPDPSKPRIT